MFDVIYTPENSLKHPLRLLSKMWRDLLASRELAWRLMVRDINAQYRQSVLGIFWAFLPPIVTAVGFTLASRANVLNIGVTSLPYPAYIMISMSLWQTFLEGLTGPPLAVTNAKQLLARINFPREAIILAKLGEIFFNFAIRLILIIVVFIWFQIPVSWMVLLAPLSLVLLIFFGMFLGTLLAPIGILYQDVTRGLTVATGLWLFLTPVVYPVPGTGFFATIVKLNPVTPLLVTTRELATTGQVSSPFQFFMVGIITIIGMFLSWVVFRLAMPFAIERVSS